MMATGSDSTVLANSADDDFGPPQHADAVEHQARRVVVRAGAP